MKDAPNLYAPLLDGARRLHDSGSCGVIAYCVLTGASYMQGYVTFERLGRVHGRSTGYGPLYSALLSVGCVADTSHAHISHMPIGEHGPLYSEACFQNRTGKRYKGSMPFVGKQLRSLSRNTPTGDWLVFTRNHVAAIKDGVLQDWTAKGTRHIICAMMRVTTQETI